VQNLRLLGDIACVAAQTAPLSTAPSPRHHAGTGGVGGRPDGACDRSPLALSPVEAQQDKLLTATRPDGAIAYTPLIAVGLMAFYVFALMCMSTIAVTIREAGGGRIGWTWAGV